MLHNLVDTAARRLGWQRLSEPPYQQAIDRLFAAYVEWRVESLAARDAYNRSAAARGLSGRDAFAVYFAALDREERAAAEYAACVEEVCALVSRAGDSS